MSFNGDGGTVTAELAARIADYLDSYLVELRPEERITLDGSVTGEPDTFEFYRDDLSRNYSATHALLRFPGLLPVQSRLPGLLISR